MRTGMPTWAALGLALVAVLGTSQGDPTDDAQRGRIGALVRQLGDKEFARREAASKELDAIGEPARDALKAATAGADAEVRQRAEKVLVSLDAKARAAAARADLDRLQGTWYAVSVQYGGTTIGVDRTDTITYEGT